MKTVSKLISGIIASVMTVTALPVQLFASAADQTKEITILKLEKLPVDDHPEDGV